MTALASACTSFQPGVIVDVGANEGEWSQHAHSLWPGATLLMLEADSQHEKSLREGAEKIHGSVTIGVFSSKEGDTVDFYAGGDTGNSMFKENSEHFTNDVPVRKTTLTIDGVVHRSGVGKPVDILKLDIQGLNYSPYKEQPKCCRRLPSCRLKHPLLFITMVLLVIFKWKPFFARKILSL
ncbi:methyltransferase [Fragilaria crotonensis]|nr:methyltransferase [Fragilaria crotonensis]